MKADETRRNLINELNAKFSETGSFFGASEDPGDPIITFPSPTFEKPKMFEPLKVSVDNTTNLMSSIPVVKGMGFRDNSNVVGTPTNKKKIINEKPQEIYSMKELIDSNPEGMRTLSLDTKTIKAQYAIVKRREWQDILFEDVNWFQPIDITFGLKKLFKL